jgi:hypothetical protein
MILELNEMKKEKLNGSSYYDPTAYVALQKVSKEEKELSKKVSELLKVLKVIIEWAGFELIGRIWLKDKKTGKEFK